MSTRVPVLFAAALTVATSGAAQNLDFSISPSPVGSGARAAGMANAFVAIADDATAASWNPAGLVQLERPEISVVGAFNYLTEDIEASDARFFDSTADDFTADLNFLSFTYPLPFAPGGRNATVSLSYQRKYDFSRNFDLDFDLGFVNQVGQQVDQLRNFQFDQDGGLATITPAVAVELTRNLSVGVAWNFWRSSFLSQNDWEQTLVITNDASVDGFELPTTVRTIEEEYDGLEGENFSIGVLWTPTQKLSFGFRYDSAWTGDVEFTSREFGTIVVGVQTNQESRRVDFPDSFTWGAAYRFNDRLSIALDFTRTDWNDFVLIDADGNRFSLITGENSDADSATDLDPTLTVRLGAEYVFIPDRPREQLRKMWSLRGGVFYDEEPASNRPTGTTDTPGDGSPDRFFGISAGVGLQAFHRVNIDVGYQVRFGLGVESDRINGLTGFEEDVIQHRLLLSTVIYF